METKSRIYKLYELRDELKSGINNITKVIEQQNTLCEIIEASDKKDAYVDFIKGIKSTNKTYANQIETFTNRLNVINGLLELYEKRDDKSELIDSIITATLFALGIADTNTLEKEESNTEPTEA